MSYTIQLEAKLVTRWIFLGEHCNHHLTYPAQDALKNAFQLYKSNLAIFSGLFKGRNFHINISGQPRFQ